MRIKAGGSRQKTIARPAQAILLETKNHATVYPTFRTSRLYFPKRPPDGAQGWVSDPESVVKVAESIRHKLLIANGLLPLMVGPPVRAIPVALLARTIRWALSYFL